MVRLSNPNTLFTRLQQLVWPVPFPSDRHPLNKDWGLGNLPPGIWVCQDQQQRKQQPRKEESRTLCWSCGQSLSWSWFSDGMAWHQHQGAGECCQEPCNQVSLLFALASHLLHSNHVSLAWSKHSESIAQLWRKLVMALLQMVKRMPLHLGPRLLTCGVSTF